MENKTKIVIGVSAAAILVGAVVGILVFKPKGGKEMPPAKKAYAKAGQDIYEDMYNTDVSFASGDDMELKVISCDEITGVCKVQYSNSLVGNNITGYILKTNIIYK